MTGPEILDLRNGLGLTQDQLAEQIGVNRTTVTLWETGKRNPSGSAVILLGQLKARLEQRESKKTAARS